jgi:hypothetical protein
MSATLTVICGDVLETACDVLVLKYAQKFYGADLAVADALGLRKKQFQLPPGQHLLLPTAGKVSARHVLLIGVQPLYDFTYSEIRSFSNHALAILEEAAAESQSVAMTMHGIGYGLDEREAFTAQVAGLMEFLTASASPSRVRQILIVEREPNRSHRIGALLREILLESGYGTPQVQSSTRQPRLPDAGIRSTSKRHVFVAMPYNEEMEDVYEFGIRDPVNEAGCLCERCDRDIFTGDILERIKDRIAGAYVMIADMTGSNPNVYLEVGFAWGKGVSTLLIARDGEELKFDVKTQKCIYYKNILSLKKQLSQYMVRLMADDPPAAGANLARRGSPWSDRG